MARVIEKLSSDQWSLLISEVRDRPDLLDLPYEKLNRHLVGVLRRKDTAQLSGAVLVELRRHSQSSQGKSLHRPGSDA